MNPIIKGVGLVRVDDHDQYLIVGTVKSNTEGEWVGENELRNRIFRWIIPDDKQLWRCSPSMGAATDIEVEIEVDHVEVEEVGQGEEICRIGIILGRLMKVSIPERMNLEE